LSKSLTLIGFQACGKSTLGKLLADYLQRPFIDSDKWIEKKHPSLSCCEVFTKFGVDYFREVESQIIFSLKYKPPIVLATGGGSLLKPCNGEYLQKNSLLIYLKTDPSILKERIWQRERLPAYLEGGDPHQAFIRIYEERIAIYEKWANLSVKMDGLTIEAALHRLITLLSN
jgi:shikimate kinase